MKHPTEWPPRENPARQERVLAELEKVGDDELATRSTVPGKDGELALTALLLRNEGRFRAAFAQTGVRREALDDALQNASLHLMRIRERYNGNHPWPTWAVLAARNYVIDLWREDGRDLIKGAGGLDVEPPNHDLGPDEAMIEQEEAARLADAVLRCTEKDAGLTEEEKLILREVVMKGRKARDVATEAGHPPPEGDRWAHNLKTSALRKMRECLERKGFGE